MNAVSTAELAALHRAGHSMTEIATRVGMTRQGVCYRLHKDGILPPHRPAPNPTAIAWTSRAPRVPPKRCADCPRRITGMASKMGPRGLLPDDDYCRYCARPVTGRARALAPNFSVLARR